MKIPASPDGERRPAVHYPARANPVGSSLLAIVCLLFAPLTAPAQTTGNCAPGTATADLDINNVRAGIYNHGGLFGSGTNPQYEVPKGGGAHSFFAAGLWIGGLVDGEIRTAGATYSDWEFWPGPLDAQGNPPADCSAYDRIFKVGRRDIDALDSGGQPTPDIADWPWQLGAPVLDGDGDPGNYDLSAGDRPLIQGDQTLWWIMNDAGNDHRGISEISQIPGPPLGLEVQTTAFAFDQAGALGNTTFYHYRVVNNGRAAIDSLFFGIWSDPDVGNAGDDYVGTDSIRGIGFAYNGDDLDEGTGGYGDTPPAVGFDFLSGPSADNDGVDNDHDGQADEAGETVRMTNFVFYNSDASPMGNPVGPAQHYSYLRSIWKDGVPVTFGGRGRSFSQEPTTMMYTGDPPAFWSEENIDGSGLPNVPTDRRFVVSSGPVRLERGAVGDYLIAVLWARGSDRRSSVQLLKANSDEVQRAYDAGALTTVGVQNRQSPVTITAVSAWPNPFRTSVNLRVIVARPQRLEVAVFDMLGRRVASIADEYVARGRHVYEWDAAGAPAGLYFYLVRATGRTMSGALIRVR